MAIFIKKVEDLLHERGIDVSYETVRCWWNRFGPLFSSEIRKRRVRHGSYSPWRWHLDEVFVRINGEAHYLWQAVDHEGEIYGRPLIMKAKFLRSMSRNGGITGCA